MDPLLKKIKKCTLCKAHLPSAPRPILNFSKTSKIMIIGQAPGIRAHDTQTPWNDPSGDRLRLWLGIDKDQFYDASLVAIVPMGFCYPGKAKTGDKPPRPECAPKWMPEVLEHLTEVKYKFLIGQYAVKYFLGDKKPFKLTDIIKEWSQGKDGLFILPHPSPRNNIWLKQNPWFEKKVLPVIKKNVTNLFAKDRSRSTL